MCAKIIVRQSSDVCVGFKYRAKSKAVEIYITSYLLLSFHQCLM